MTEISDEPSRRRREDRLEELVEELATLNKLGSENFRKYRRRSALAFIILAVGCAMALWLAQHNASIARNDLAREAKARAVVLADQAARTRHQFCELVIGTHNDRVKRYRATIRYLKSPAGREPTLLNEYIRDVSLPQTRAELARENDLTPPVCK